MPEVPDGTWGVPLSKQHACALCHGRDCCLSFSVPLSGADIARISRALAVPPMAFCQAAPAPGPPAFRLDPSAEQGYRVQLRRRPAAGSSPAAAGPCIFLLDLPRGKRRCVLERLQPGLCRSFPLALDPFGSLSVYQGHGCPRLWSLGDVDELFDRPLAERLDRDTRRLLRQAREWDELLVAQGRPAALSELIDFLMEDEP